MDINDLKKFVAIGQKMQNDVDKILRDEGDAEYLAVFLLGNASTVGDNDDRKFIEMGGRILGQLAEAYRDDKPDPELDRTMAYFCAGCLMGMGHRVNDPILQTHYKEAAEKLRVLANWNWGEMSI